MAKITASAPVLLVSDVVASANYVRDAVGFAYHRLWGDPPDVCICDRDGHHDIAFGRVLHIIPPQLSRGRGS